LLSLFRSKERIREGDRVIAITEILMAIDLYLLVDDVMTRWPATIRVFLDFKLACIGCPIASFHSINDACREHGIDQTSFMAALRGAVG